LVQKKSYLCALIFKQLIMSDPMKNYEVTFIVDSVLSSEEINATAQTYADLLRQKGCSIVHVDEMGLRQLAYPINRRNSGVYFCIEFEVPSGDLITDFELALRRDERVMRFLTVRLDKYGVKYNSDKRNGLIGKTKKKEKVEKGDFNDRPQRPRHNAPSAPPAAADESAQ
jgi:small subunit ribosomal protein S6